MTSVRDRRRDDLIDTLAANPNGLTRYELMASEGVSWSMVGLLIREARLYLGEADDVNVVCRRDARGEWRYYLVGDYDGAKPWFHKENRYIETRMETVGSVASSIVRATPGRTVEGRLLRIYERTLRRLHEDIAEIELESATP